MRFVPNRGLSRQIEESPTFKAGLKAAAEPAETIAKSIAKAEAYDKGDYERSIEVAEVDGDVVLQATDFKAWWIERGAPGRTPPFPARAPLRRGAQGAGLKFRESSR